jgi:uncharacterized UBP type Zn finger protein
MNSVLQIFLNSQIIKQICLDKNFEKTICLNNKLGHGGELIKEFLKLMKEKWNSECKTISPQGWKTIIGKLNTNFSGSDQQDANEYLLFMLDGLHEEINIVGNRKFIPNPLIYNGVETELSAEYWSNNLRRNISFFHSIFLGQMKSSLICKKCEVEKVSYETFLSLNIPIPQNNTISIEIILHRLPYTYKLYCEKLGNNNNIRKQLDSIRKKSFDMSESIFGNDINDSIYFSVNSEHHDHNANKANFKENLNSLNLLNTIKTDKNQITSKLSYSIPIKITMELNVNDNVNKIIENLKSKKYLDLETITNYTNFIIYNGKLILNSDLKVDESLENLQQIHIFEVLNYKGLCKIFEYVEENNIQLYNNDSIKEYNDSILKKRKSVLGKQLVSDKLREIVVHIYHKYAYFSSNYLFNKVMNDQLISFPSLFLLPNKVIFALY